MQRRIFIKQKKSKKKVDKTGTFMIRAIKLINSFLTNLLLKFYLLNVFSIQIRQDAKNSMHCLTYDLQIIDCHNPPDKYK